MELEGSYIVALKEATFSKVNFTRVKPLDSHGGSGKMEFATRDN